MNFKLIAGDRVPFKYEGDWLRSAVQTTERAIVFAALSETDGNKKKASALLKCAPKTLDRIYKELLNEVPVPKKSEQKEELLPRGGKSGI